LAGVILALGLALSAGAAGPVAPEYAARRLGGSEPVSLASLRGQVVLRNTWATWCSPCRKEMPAFQALHQAYRDRGLTVVGVNIDEGRSDDGVTRYVEGKGISFPIWRDPDNRFAKRFRVLRVPETFLVDRDGGIVRHWRGPMDPQAPDNLASIQAALGADGASAARGWRLADLEVEGPGAVSAIADGPP
jgi:cytochrome c-type biogenesis protein